VIVTIVALETMTEEVVVEGTTMIIKIKSQISAFKVVNKKVKNIKLKIKKEGKIITMIFPNRLVISKRARVITSRSKSPNRRLIRTRLKLLFQPTLPPIIKETKSKKTKLNH